MTTDDLRAAADALTRLHERFAPRFGRQEARAQSLVYLNGLLLGQERKSAEPMALTFGSPDDDGLGQNQVLALQRFLTASPWDYQGVQREIQAVVAEPLQPAADWSIGTVGVLDSSGFVKKGKESAGLRNGFFFALAMLRRVGFRLAGGAALSTCSVVRGMVLLAPGLVPPSTIRLTPFRLLGPAAGVAQACP